MRSCLPVSTSGLEVQANAPQQIRDLHPLVPRPTEPSTIIENSIVHGLVLEMDTHTFMTVKLPYPSCVY